MSRAGGRSVSRTAIWPPGWAGLLLAGAVLLLAGGCQAHLRLAVDVAADGSGAVTVVLRADAELAQRLAEADADPLGALARTGRSLEEAGWRTTDVTGQDGSREVGLTAPFADEAAFNALAADLVAALRAPEATLLEALELTVLDDALRVEGVAGILPGPAITELGLQPEQAEQLLRDTDGLRYEVAVSLPGELLDTTAPDPESQPLVWRVEPGERVLLVAESDRPRSRLWVPLVTGGVGGLVALALIRRLGRADRQARTDARQPQP